MKSIIALFSALTLITACSHEDVVNIYSSRHYDTDISLYNNFTEQTGIKINLIEGSSDELIERIRNEGLNSPADVIITVDAGRLWRAKEAGVLQTHRSHYLSEVIPDQMQDIEGYWVGLSERVRGIIYNPGKVTRADLEGYMELSSQKWKGRVCVRSSNNIYNQSLVSSLIETYGEDVTEEWALGLVRNFARVPQGGDTDQLRAVAAGLCDVALVNHYYLARLIQSGTNADKEVASNVAIYFPSMEYGGTHINISGAGIAANSPNRENAVRFLEYLATREAQMIFAIGNNEFPVLDSLELPNELLNFGTYDSDAVNVTTYGANNPRAIRLMDRVGWR